MNYPRKTLNRPKRDAMLQQQIERLSQLPKTKQVIIDMLEDVLSQANR